MVWRTSLLTGLVTCQVSHGTCRLSPVTCCMSLMPTATARDPSPTNCPSMESRMLLLILTWTHQQWVAKTQKSTSARQIFNNIWPKIVISETNSFFSLFFLQESFCNWLISLMTFLYMRVILRSKNYLCQNAILIQWVILVGLVQCVIPGHIFFLLFLVESIYMV